LLAIFSCLNIASAAPDTELEKQDTLPPILDEKIVDTLIKTPEVVSLMYSPEEISKINEAIEAYKNNEVLVLDDEQSNEETLSTKPEEKAEVNSRSYVYLGSILYYSPTNWSVWINDKKISYHNNDIESELYIKNINKDYVDIVWLMSISKWKILANKIFMVDIPVNKNNQVEFNFSLSFNQTYMLNGERIVEGRIAPSFFKAP
jgi:hypothetical protein